MCESVCACEPALGPSQPRRGEERRGDDCTPPTTTETPPHTLTSHITHSCNWPESRLTRTHTFTHTCSLSIQFNSKRLYWHDCIQYNVAKACLHKMRSEEHTSELQSHLNL